MSFAENALQYIDACNSTTEDADAFKDIMMWKAANRSATYIGWTAPKSQVAGTPTARYIFDRLLGAHDSAVPMEDPVQRPFDVAAIFDDLKSFDLGESTHGGTITHYTTVPTKPILTPSIEYIDMWDYDGEMRIKGLFGGGGGSSHSGWTLLFQWIGVMIFSSARYLTPALVRRETSLYRYAVTRAMSFHFQIGLSR